MLVNADLTKRALVRSDQLPWVPSPLPGVERRLLERDGGEVARATSIVRYAPKSFFASHTHDEGEEFFVLDGVFSDEQGDFPAGMYVRNPPGSSHRPHSAEGCTLFVKLRQMDEDDSNHVVVDTNTAAWLPGLSEGLTVIPLYDRNSEDVALLRFEPETRLRRHDHPDGEEILVLSGSLEDEHGRYPKGTWLRNPPGSSHQPFSTEGCVIFIKTGHLGLAATART